MEQRPLRHAIIIAMVTAVLGLGVWAVKHSIERAESKAEKEQPTQTEAKRLPTVLASKAWEPEAQRTPTLGAAIVASAPRDLSAIEKEYRATPLGLRQEFEKSVVGVHVEFDGEIQDVRRQDANLIIFVAQKRSSYGYVIISFSVRAADHAALLTVPEGSRIRGVGAIAEYKGTATVHLKGVTLTY